ncbi:DUF2786 domain-containing protein [Pseudomonas caspiana]|uniref:Uncharacterized protein n=1 Tax=Pseudomonas caspiana TaxID=1451454 RepID=A0A1Y3NV60_9PSED|nr:DUF2786 domain-containing protein [Pseudomonas caspiana]OUM71485.1 hypothetical protein AUC60_22970 [Pseudomonas caspiana]
MSEQPIDQKKLERAIRKIKHCLALAQSPNENEAATAMRQAQGLMRAYQLTETDVKLSDVGEVESSMSRTLRRPVWDQNLSVLVAQVFNCQALRYKHWCKLKGRRVERATFVGVSPSQHIALYAYETLLTKLIQARKEYITGIRAGRYRSAYSPATAGDHFAIAWVGAVHRKLQDLVPRGEEDQLLEQDCSGRHLVAVEAKHKTLIAEFLSNQQIGKPKKAREIELDLDAQIAGMLAGQKVELHAGLTSGADDLLALSACA